MKKITLATLLISVIFNMSAFSQASITYTNPNTANVGQVIHISIYGSNTNFSSGTNTATLVPNGGGSQIVGSSLTSSNFDVIDAVFDFTGATTGKYDVVVTNSFDGTLTKPSYFTVTNIAAGLVQVTPNNASTGDSLDITVYGSAGTHFTQATNTLKLIKSNNPAKQINPIPTPTVNSDNEIVGSFKMPNTAADTGKYDVVVSNSVDGTLTLPASFTLGMFTPVILSIAPNNANTTESVSLFIQGDYTHFQQNPGSNTVTLVKAGSPNITSSSLNPTSNTSMFANFTIPGGATLGSYDVVVTDTRDGTITLPASFDVTNNPPQLQNINPNNANFGQTVDVSITALHTHFNQGGVTNTVSFVKVGNPGVQLTPTISVTNATTLSAHLVIPASPTFGFYDVVVSNNVDGTLTLPGAFEITNHQPQITYINPDTANAGQVFNMTLTGQYTNFQSAGSNTLTLFQSSAQIGSTGVNASNNTSLAANFNIPSNAPAGQYDVIVTNSIDGTITHLGFFTLLAPAAITSISPASGGQGSALTVAVTVANVDFTKATSDAYLSKTGSTQINKDAIVVVSPSKLNVTFTIPPTATVGFWDLNISYTPTGANTIYITQPAGFEVKKPAGIATTPEKPGNISLSPNPFNESTTLTYHLEQTSSIEISIFNVLGEKVKSLINAVQSAGDHTLLIDNTDMQDKGVYFISVKTGNNKPEMIKSIRE